MASIKISELNEKTNLIDNDLVAVVDTIADETKKMTFNNLKTQIINDKFAILQYIEPSSNKPNLKTVELPSGYTKENCVVISWMRKNTSSDIPLWQYMPIEAGGTTGRAQLLQIADRNIGFYDTEAYLSTDIYEYRIVLMKVA